MNSKGRFGYVFKKKVQGDNTAYGNTQSIDTQQR